MLDINLYQGRHCACNNLRKATRAITQFYDNYLQKSGLKVTQYSLLMTVARNKNISINELADLLIMDQTTVTRNIMSLKNNGYIEITREKDDGRKRLVSLTSQGREKINEAMSLWDQAQTKIETNLGDKGYQDFLNILADLTKLVR